MGGWAILLLVKCMGLGHYKEWMKHGKGDSVSNGNGMTAKPVYSGQSLKRAPA